MHRIAFAAVLSALTFAPLPAFADGPAKPPDAARVRTAAEQFDAGVAAFKAKDFDTAASHFEAADAAVATPKALRQAIRARMEAGQTSRAATLAALALDRYGSDEATAKLSRETMEKLGPKLQKVNVSCVSPCVLAIGVRSVPGEAATRWTVYLDPGKETLSASFFGGVSSAAREITGKAGGSVDVRFEPEEKKAAPAVVVPVPSAPPPRTDTPPEPPKEEPAPKGISPAFFGVALAVTAGLGGTTIWSGIDTINNPGAEAVKKACQTNSPDCQTLNDQGVAHQRRTNILIGATAGAGAVTIILAIFTRWRSPKKAAPVALTTGPQQAGLGSAQGKPGPRVATPAKPAPRASSPIGAITPTVIPIDRGAAIGATGSF